MTIEFEAWPKTPRLFRDITITEKIDGTNAAIIIEPHELDSPPRGRVVNVGGEYYEVGAQSRKRLITPQKDNFGFAWWVATNAEPLVELLGPGRHFGEWWGSGIQRGYGLKDKRFSLFNTHKWGDVDFAAVEGLGVVPVCYIGPFSTQIVNEALADLKINGSRAVPGWHNPEGVVVYHHASHQVFKYTEDDTHKEAA